MNNDELLEQHANEFKKIDYNILLSIAKSGDPLTYTFEDENGSHQIELFFDYYNDKKMEMVLAIDSNWRGRFDKKTKARVFEIFPSKMV